MHLLSKCGTKQRKYNFSNGVFEDPGSVATETASPGTMFCHHLPEKTVCFHLLSSLLNETRKRPSFRMKVVEDLNYCTIGTETYCPGELGCRQLAAWHSSCFCSQIVKRGKEITFFQTKLLKPWLDSYRNRMSRYNVLRTTTRKNRLLPSAVKFVE